MTFSELEATAQSYGFSVLHGVELFEIRLPKGFQMPINGRHFVLATGIWEANDLIMRIRMIMKSCPKDCQCLQ